VTTVDVKFDGEYEHAAGGAFNPESVTIEKLPDEFAKSDPMTECALCRRSFKKSAYVTHSKICSKVFCAKRKVFDSAKKRNEGTELAAFNEANAKSAGKIRLTVAGHSDLQAAYSMRDYNSSSTQQANFMPKWKRDSLLFRQAMKCVREYGAETKAAETQAVEAKSAVPKLPQRIVDRSSLPVKPLLPVQTSLPVKSTLSVGFSFQVKNSLPVKPTVPAKTSLLIKSTLAVKSSLPVKSTLPSTQSRIGTVPPKSTASRPISIVKRTSSISSLAKPSPFPSCLPTTLNEETSFPEIEPSVLKCPHCSRSFNEKAVDRHILLCGSIMHKPSRLSRGSAVLSHSTGYH
jgi:zinc-finger of a C2HC-type